MFAGALFERLAARPAAWLAAQLLSMLALDGRLLLTNVIAGHPWGPWLRHVVGWQLEERDQDAVLLLLGDASAASDAAWESDAARVTWLVTLRAAAGSMRRGMRAAA